MEHSFLEMVCHLASTSLNLARASCAAVGVAGGTALGTGFLATGVVSAVPPLVVPVSFVAPPSVVFAAPSVSAPVVVVESLFVAAVVPVVVVLAVVLPVLVPVAAPPLAVASGVLGALPSTAVIALSAIHPEVLPPSGTA